MTFAGAARSSGFLRVGLACLALAGCGGGDVQPRSAARVDVTPLTIEVPSLPSRAPRVPKPEVRLELSHYHRFVTLRIPRPRFPRMELGTLTNLLPEPVRARLGARVKALDDLRRVADEARAARLDSWDCRGARSAGGECPEARELERAEKRAAERLAATAARVERENEDAVIAFEKARSEPGADEAAISVAIARVHELDDERSDAVRDDRPPAVSIEYGEPLDAVRGASLRAVAAYERARQLAGPETEVGADARFGLAAQLLAGGDTERCIAVLEELERGAARRRVVSWLIGVLRAAGPNRDYAASARALRAALAAPEPVEGPTRTDVLLALMMAEYRSGRFARALEAAIGAMESEHAGRRAASVAWALRGATISPYGAERIAVDCIDRLGEQGADLRAASAETFAAIQARLAMRAFHRGDLSLARRAAEAALAKAPAPGAAEAVDVLVAIARTTGDATGARALARRKEELTKGSTAGLTSIFGRFGVIGLLGTSPSVEDDERRSIDPSEEVELPGAEAEPKVRRNVEELVRLCLEPAHADLERKPGRTAKVEIEASVFEDGTADVIARAIGDDSLDSIVECMRSAGPRLFAGAPSSARAVVDVTQAHVPEWLAKGGAALFVPRTQPLDGTVGGLGVKGIDPPGAAGGTKAGLPGGSASKRRETGRPPAKAPHQP